ncbi:MAG: hypothetical protein Q7S16_03920 [bacterium]|nr:hypothetical protein [bacterium]
MNNSKKFILFILGVDVLLVTLHIFFGARFDLFNLDRERTPGAYWSGAQLLVVAALAVGMILLSSTRWRRVLWGMFGFLFMSFGFDEISELHENITYYVSNYLHIPIPSFFRSTTYNWLIILSPFIIAAFIFLLTFVRTLRQERGGKILGLGIFLFLLAIFTELSNGLDVSLQFYNVLVVLEESLELFGESLALWGMLRIATDHFDNQFMRKV